MNQYVDLKRFAPLPLAILLGVGSFLLFGQGGERVLLVAAGLAVVALLVAALAMPWLTLMVVPAAIPLGDAAVGGGLLSVGLGASLLVVGLVVVGRLLRGLSPIPVPVAGWWMLGLVVLLVLSTPGAVSSDLALRQLAGIAIGALMALCIATTCHTERAIKRAVGFVLAGGGAALALGLTKSASVSASYGGAVVEGSIGIYSEHNQAGSLGAALFVLAVGAACAARGPLTGLLTGAVAVLGLVQTALSLSRGAWIGAVLGLVVLVVLAPRVLRPLLTGVALAGVLLLAVSSSSPVFEILAHRAGTIGKESPAAADERPTIWREALREFDEAPLLGHGPGSFRVVAGQSSSLAYTARPVHAHNLLLTVAAEDGGLAVLAVLGLTLAVGAHLWRAIRTSPPHAATLSAGVAAALCTFVGQGLVDVPLRNTSIEVLMWLLVGLALGCGGRRDGLPEGAGPTSRVTGRSLA